MNSMLLSALGAMVRGEDPASFLKNLVRSNSKLQEMTQGMNLDDLEGTAQTICDQNGRDIKQVADEIKGFANSNKIF